jgi:hypothetical protein
MHRQPGGRGGRQLIDADQFDGTVLRVRVIDPTGGPHPHAGDLGHEDGTGQLLAQHRDRIEQIEHHLLDDLPGGGIDEHRSVGAHRENPLS